MDGWCKIISYSRFLSWAERRFGDVVVKGNEIMLNSIFENDFKHHMSCNPSGGKHKRPNGVFKCWKTKKSGSLITLVRMVDHCTYDDAMEILGGEYILGDLNERIDQFYSQIQEKETEATVSTKLNFPESTFPILSLPEDNIWRTDAEFYLLNRKLSPDNFLICTNGKYQNRIVIPYYNKDKELIYFNARLLVDNKNLPKYRGPEKECGIGKSDVIYMAGGNWPDKNEEVYLTEGEFDAETLFVAGFNSAAFGGKEIYNKQIEYISNYIPVISVDTDEAGDDALLSIGDKLISKGFTKVFYIRPPSVFKDWNEMLVKHSPNLIKAYISKNKKEYDNNTSIRLRIDRL